MKRLSCIKFVVCSLGLAIATAAWAQSPPPPPTILYGTTTLLAPTNEFAVATTLPTLENPRAQYVVVAEANDNQDLEVLAWHDTTSSLASIGHGVAEHHAVVGVAVTGLDPSRVVTADIKKEGVLSINTWKVGTGGVVSLRSYRTAAATASQDVAIATVSGNEVVTAYETTSGNLVVEAFTIAGDGLPAPKTVLGNGPKVFEAYIAAIGPHQVVTAAGDSTKNLWVNTWQIDGAGVTPQHQVETNNALSTVCFVAPRPQTVAVGAGRSFELQTPSGSTPHVDFVRSAFTPVITPGCQLQVYYWGVSDTGVLTLESTTTPTEAGDFGQVAASMLPRNIPITSYTGGTGNNNVFIQNYQGFSLTALLATYSNPYGVLNIGSAPAGTDLSRLSLFSPYSAYFISAGQFNPEEGVADGTLYINVLSYPEAPLL